jgi:hypothetical protein
MKRHVKRHAVIQPLDQSYRLIPLTQGQNSIVDAKDFERLSLRNWYAVWSPHTKSFYAATNISLSDGKQRMIQMTTEVLGLEPGIEVDHRNHDTLDNRRQNLRESEGSQNAYNRRKRHDNTSGYIGVSWVERLKKWRVLVRSDGRRVSGGCFTLLEEAVEIRDKIAKELHGEFASLNS